ncbi:MAG UNVERIFIED_CONTAM: hypothetical protein LVR18_46380 [Planctomycetaceae bacterium]|jgi:hypothetical protein
MAERQMSAEMSAGQRLEILSMRSKAVRSRVRLLQKLNRGTEALAGLQQQLAADEASVQAFTASHELRKAYGSTSMQLQKQLMQLSRQTEARDVSRRWIELAEQLQRGGTETERDLVFLMGARHTAGHTFEMCGDREGAFEHYSAAAAVCERASAAWFSGSFTGVSGAGAALSHGQCAGADFGLVCGGGRFFGDSSERLRSCRRWPARAEVKPDSIPRQLQGTVELLERVGFAAEAGKWKAELQERKLIR